MDFNKLIPDFGSIGKTEWNKPCFDTKDKFHIAGLACAVLLVIFCFIPWFVITMKEGPISVDASRLGIGLWYGIFAFIGGAVALYGMLYKNYQFAFCGAAIALLMAILGLFIVPSVEVAGLVTVPAEAVKLAIKAGATTSRIGAILALIASAGVGACAFLKINEK